MKRKFRVVLGIVFWLIAIALMYIWAVYGKDALTSKYVAIAINDIEKGTVIDDVNKYFTFEARDSETLINGAITDVETLIQIQGLAADQFIPKNSQININFFKKERMVISGDRVVFRVPNNWIYAIPSSIRRGDDIYFYEVDSNLEYNINSQQIDNNIPIYNNKINFDNYEPILKTTLLYVKDSSNREVVDYGKGPRLDGSSQINSIEISITNEEIKLLQSKIAQGKKFIIVYQ